MRLSVSELPSNVIPRNRRVWIFEVLSPSSIELRALLCIKGEFRVAFFVG